MRITIQFRQIQQINHNAVTTNNETGKKGVSYKLVKDDVQTTGFWKLLNASQVFNIELEFIKYNLGSIAPQTHTIKSQDHNSKIVMKSIHYYLC